jgi:hypothetical protein
MRAPPPRCPRPLPRALCVRRPCRALCRSEGGRGGAEPVQVCGRGARLSRRGRCAQELRGTKDEIEERIGDIAQQIAGERPSAAAKAPSTVAQSCASRQLAAPDVSCTLRRGQPAGGLAEASGMTQVGSDRQTPRYLQAGLPLTGSVLRRRLVLTWVLAHASRAHIIARGPARHARRRSPTGPRRRLGRPGRPQATWACSSTSRSSWSGTRRPTRARAACASPPCAAPLILPKPC